MPYAVIFVSYVWGFESFAVMNLCLLSSLYTSHKCKKKVEYGERTKENGEGKIDSRTLDVLKSIL